MARNVFFADADLSRVCSEGAFAAACLAYMIGKRDEALLRRLSQAQIFESYRGIIIGRELSQERQGGRSIRREMQSYTRIYEGMNKYAEDQKESIEHKHRAFFSGEDLTPEQHEEKFTELLNSCATEKLTGPFNYEKLIEFCAHVSVYAYLSYRKVGNPRVVENTVRRIIGVLRQHDVTNAQTFYQDKDLMAHHISISDIVRERVFATGCLIYMINERDRELPLDFLNAQQNEDSDEEPNLACEVDINQTISSYKRIYEAINKYAVDHIERIESEYRSFFTEHRDIMEPHDKNFLELVSRYAKGLIDRPFSYAIIISFCAYVGVFGYMSYKAKTLQQVVMYAVSSIVYILTYYGFEDAKYTELRLRAENLL